MSTKSVLKLSEKRQAKDTTWTFTLVSLKYTDNGMAKIKQIKKTKDNQRQAKRQ